MVDDGVEVEGSVEILGVGVEEEARFSVDVDARFGVEVDAIFKFARKLEVKFEVDEEATPG